MAPNSRQDMTMRSTALPDQISIVAVPIGNVQDLTPRARDALASAQVIFCEDTRKTADLLKRAEVQSPAKLISIPGDSEHQLDWMRYCRSEYRHWVMVSDAGTPVVNDPGTSLIGFAQKHQIKTQALPGASAPIAAWQWSGGFGLPFIFGGFAPKVTAAATSKWDRFLPQATQGTFCFFDTRHQVLDTLDFLRAAYPQARLHIAREMTKAHEELLSGAPEPLWQALAKLIESDRVGELCVLLDLSSVAAPAGETVVGGGITVEDLVAFRSGSTKDASKLLAKWTTLSARDAYKRLCDEEH